MGAISIATEAARLDALHRYQILDTDTETAFDDLTQLAAHICQTPIALINFIDAKRQWFKAKIGLNVSEMPREIGICPKCIAHGKLLIIPDTLSDPDWATDAVVVNPPYVRFYAGVPLITPTGQPIGTLCVVDQVPRQLTHAQVESLEMLGRQIMAQLELRRNFVTLAKSIAERQQAELKIQEQAALLDFATDAIFVCDLHHRIIFWNKGAERLFGWQANEAIAQDANELLYQEPSPQLETALKTVLEQGEWMGELHKVTQSNREIIVESRWALVRDSSGCPKSILTVDTDVTEQKKLEAQFFRTQRLESIGTLASGIAHDLNNILTPILAATQLLPLKLQHLDDHSQQLLKMLEINAKRGADLVRQVLSFSRGLEGKRMILQLRHIIFEIEKILRETFPKSIEVDLNVPQDLWTVLGDSTQLHQVLMNLCVNARDAMPEGGRLEISASNQWLDENFTRMELEAKVGAYTVLRVVDSGMGMSPEVIDRIFEPFFTTKELGCGTGLGLSTVAGIVKSHGGFVTVSSKVGSGTELKVFLPAVMTQEVLPTDDDELPLGEGQLILVVDDETPVRMVLKASLESYGYRVLTADDGIEAIALYAQHKGEIHLILIDLMMPAMDGITTLRTLQKMNSDIQAIAMTGLSASDKIAEAANAGVKDFLSKPFTVKELLQALHAFSK